MNFNPLSLFVRPPRQPLRAIVATRSESKAAARKREETTAALRRIVTEQILVAAAAQAILPSSTPKIQRATGRGER